MRSASDGYKGLLTWFLLATLGLLAPAAQAGPISECSPGPPAFPPQFVSEPGIPNVDFILGCGNFSFTTNPFKLRVRAPSGVPATQLFEEIDPGAIPGWFTWPAELLEGGFGIPFPD